MIMAFWAPCVNVGCHDVLLFPAIFRKPISVVRREIGIMCDLWCRRVGMFVECEGEACLSTQAGCYSICTSCPASMGGCGMRKVCGARQKSMYDT